jgi:hypothetical protein
MAIKHFFSISLDDGRLSSIQLARVCSPLSVHDKHPHSSHKSLAQNFFDMVHHLVSPYVFMSSRFFKSHSPSLSSDYETGCLHNGNMLDDIVKIF